MGDSDRVDSKHLDGLLAEVAQHDGELLLPCIELKPLDGDPILFSSGHSEEGHHAATTGQVQLRPKRIDIEGFWCNYHRHTICSPATAT